MNNFWWSIGDVKITSEELEKIDIQEIRKLLDDESIPGNPSRF